MIGYQFYPPKESEHYKLLELDKYKNWSSSCFIAIGFTKSYDYKDKRRLICNTDIS